VIEKTRRTGVIRTLAERTAVHPRIQTAVITAVQSVLPGVIEELLWEMAPQGEQFRIYKPKIGKERKAARDDRIKAALEAGQATSSIAAREGVSARHVFRIKAQLVAAVEVE
jgi:hypothetical protein